MKDDTFNRYVRVGAEQAVIVDEQPYVEMSSGRLAILDPLVAQTFVIGESNPSRECRELARQLLLAADEFERRRFGE